MAGETKCVLTELTGDLAGVMGVGVVLRSYRSSRRTMTVFTYCCG